MKKRQNLSKENKDLKVRLAEAEELLAAIKSGEIDAFVTDDQQVFTLKSADQGYRILVETISEGALTLTSDGTMMYCNYRLAAMLDLSIEKIIGSTVFDFVDPHELPRLRSILRQCKSSFARAEFQLKKKNGMFFPALISCNSLKLGNASLCMVVTDLTEQKRAQATFEHANAYHRSLIEVSIDPLVTVNANGKIMDVNKAAELVTGYNREKLIGTDFADYFKEPEKARVGYKKVFREGALQDYELEIKHKDGHLTSVLYNAAVYKDETGKIAGIFSSAKDITKRKLAEEAARLANAYNRNLIEVSLDPLVTISPEGKITDVNEATVKVTGLTRKKLIGTDFSSYFTEPKKARKGYKEVFNKGFVSDYPLTIRHKNGKLTNVLYNATVYKDDRNNILGVFAAARDITEQKKSQDALQEYREHLEELVEKRTKALKESEERLRTMADSIPQLAWIAKADGYIIWYNRRWYEYTGTTAEQMEGWGWQSVHDPELLPKVLEQWKASIDTGQPFDMEFPLRGADGKLRPFLTRGIPFKDAHGRVIQWFGTNTDISERKQAEDILKRDKEFIERLVQERTRELSEAQKELVVAKRLSDIGTLAATVAHELRNPLAAIGVTAHNIKRKANNPDIEKCVHTIDKKVTESDQIINNLLFYSRLKPPHYESINILDIIEECVAAAEQQKKKEATVIKNLDSIKGITIEADPLQIREVFDNILNNAFDAIPAGKGQIKIMAENEDEFIKVTIEDSGAGIVKDILEKIFEPFFTTKAKGTGLGLSVCRQIINMHEGEIWVKSELGQGTSFIVRLPKKERISGR